MGGCGKGKPSACAGDLWVCQFKPPGNQYPHFPENVIAPTKSAADCSVSRLYASQNLALATPLQGASMWVAACLAVGGVAAFTGLAAGRFLSRRRALPIDDDEELLATNE